MLLESDPVLDSPHGPNALVMRRSGVRISEAAPRFWLGFGKVCNLANVYLGRPCPGELPVPPVPPPAAVTRAPSDMKYLRLHKERQSITPAQKYFNQEHQLLHSPARVYFERSW